MSDFTDEVDGIPAKRNYSVDINYIPPPPLLENMSGEWSSKNGLPLSAVENVPKLISPIATSSFIKMPPKSVFGYSVGDRHEVDCSEASKYSHMNGFDKIEAAMSTIKDQLSQITNTIDNLICQNVRLLEEMHAIRLELNALRSQHIVDGSSQPASLPVRFPMQTVEHIQLLNGKLKDSETYLLLVNYLSKLGGKSVSDCIGNLLRSTLTYDLAANVNWRGMNNRFSLASTPFASAIVETVMKHRAAAALCTCTFASEHRLLSYSGSPFAFVLDSEAHICNCLLSTTLLERADMRIDCQP
ncbi:hypothetical protein EG68_09839 [Paragonimus skrjabini miyazakii]|uniref:DUF4806 domain-containing protein n=1 Tax=Paragonimus skrjabini miyazakii TaxID=59628 RepID=A0A8S9YKC5_9TREM|nr:hypothetical protein EG68_09839 [Paragonimus skrjabini miyazakii]